MKLSKEEIQFIDNYLQQSDVVFVDVRAEITDHVASAVEEKMNLENITFYDAFKDFMVKNKKELLSRNNKFSSLYFHGFLNFIKTIYKPYNLIFIVFILFTFNYLKTFYDEYLILGIIKKFVFYGIIFFVFGNFIWTFLIVKKRYLYIEKAGSALLIVYYFNLFYNGLNLESDNNIYAILISLCLFFAFIVYYFSTVNKFKNIYL